jgi:hypothetical protein
MRYELSDCEWDVIRPMLPNKAAAFLASTTGAFSTASFGSCDQVHHGVICPRATVLIQLATIGLFAGGGLVSRCVLLSVQRCRRGSSC